MGAFRFQVAVSLDGYVAGPEQSVENPLGVGGMDLHRWLLELEAWRTSQGDEGGVVNASTAVVQEAQANVGAFVMGRNMFGGGPGPWRDVPPWKGWWGDDPPYHLPVFVLTHHPREPVEMEGGHDLLSSSPRGSRPGSIVRGRRLAARMSCSAAARA
jgi:dihydrofolate reductase